MTLGRRLVAEGLGTALLLATVIGSGVMGENLAGGNVAIALLANSIATGCALYALILTLGPVSGAHFNPVVTLAAVVARDMRLNEAALYAIVQIAGAFIGVAAAHIMFGQPLFFASQHERTGVGQWFAEAVATFGLLAVILGCSKQTLPSIAAAVGCYITAAYWFTASTSFANPAVTLARTASDTFAGIRFADAPYFVCAQLAGALIAIVVIRWLRQPE